MAFHQTACGNPTQELGAEDERDCCERERSRTPSIGHNQHVGGGEQPWHVRDDCHHVHMLEMKKVEAAEREQHGTQQCRRAAELETPQKPHGSSECRQVVGDHLDVESRLNRKKPI